MTKDEFKRLKVGDHFKHPWFPESIFIIAETETSFEFTTEPPTRVTDAITTTDGRRMKIEDQDVELIILVKDSG